MAGPELTADTSGNPRVEVFFDPTDLDPDAVRLRMYRLSEGRTWKVRGGVDSAVGVAALDWECPFGVESAYRAEMFDADGVSLGFTDSSSIVLDVAEAWVHNPLDPSGGVSLGKHGLLDHGGITRPTVGAVVFTEGASVGVRMGARRRGVVGLQLGFAAESVAVADALSAMLGEYETPRLGVLCLRAPGAVRFPRTFFMSVDDPTEVSVDVTWGGSRSNFVFTATEVAPPHPGLVPPFLTYEDMEAAYGTYEAAEAAYATYEEAQRDYSLAGLG